MAQVKLKKAVKKKWVEALRSGKYEQGQQSLAENGKFCCLGVLCEVAVESGLPLKVQEADNDWLRWKRYDNESSFLPARVFEWATGSQGRDEDGRWTKRSDFDLPDGGSLIAMNDRGSTFAEIADVIEREL